MDINSRIQYLIDTVFHGNKRSFAIAIGTSASVVDNIVGKRGSKPSYDIIVKICSIEKLNIKWLITGEGEPFADNPEPVPASAPPLPAEASVLLDLLRSKDETIRNQAEQIGTLKSELSHRRSTACDVPSETDAAVW